MAYPWPTPLRYGTIGPDGWDEGRWDPGCRDGRLPVLAVGSNASAEVLGDKLSALLGRGQEPVYLQVCRVAGLGVGHSAHLSTPGYVAAAPFRGRPPDTASVTATDLPATSERQGRDGAGRICSLAWLTAAQAAALDATEPNYDRLPLPRDLIVRGDQGHPVVDGPTLYVSRHGVLAQGGHPVPLMSQSQVRVWIRKRLRCIRGVADEEMFADPDVRESVRRELASGGWVAPSGL